MSASSDGDRLGPVFVIDSSSLIALKKVIPVGDQWATLVQMSNFVEAGHLASPRQVAAEVLAVAQLTDPAKESVLTACQRLGLTTRTTVEFIAWLGAQGEVPGSVSPPSP